MRWKGVKWNLGISSHKIGLKRTQVCVYYCSTYYKTVRVGGKGDSGGHVLRETTVRASSSLDLVTMEFVSYLTWC